jgi:hypothetical protein
MSRQAMRIAMPTTPRAQATPGAEGSIRPMSCQIILVMG